MQPYLPTPAATECTQPSSCLSICQCVLRLKVLPRHANGCALAVRKTCTTAPQRTRHTRQRCRHAHAYANRRERACCNNFCKRCGCLFIAIAHHNKTQSHAESARAPAPVTDLCADSTAVTLCSDTNCSPWACSRPGHRTSHAMMLYVGLSRERLRRPCKHTLIGLMVLHQWAQRGTVTGTPPLLHTGDTHGRDTDVDH